MSNVVSLADYQTAPEETQTAFTIKNFANDHLGQYRFKNGEINSEYCPFCHGGDNGDTYTFYMSARTGAYQCHRAKCGASGSFRQLVSRLGGETKIADVLMPERRNNDCLPSETTYVKPDPAMLRPITEEIETYFGQRGISRNTLDAWKIASDEYGNIVFPFYENDELVYVKYRHPYTLPKDSSKPKEWCMSNTKPILFGMDNVSFTQPLVITEGQIDAMSLYEVGVTNVVSVPAGCNNMDWVKNCWKWLEKFNQIILFGDNDKPGREMVQTLVKRLGDDRCMLPPRYPTATIDNVSRSLKDANEILYYCGPDALRQVFEACEPAPVDGILNVADVQITDPRTIPRIYTRIPSLDKAIAGFGEGGLTVISGKRGEGKSTISGSFLLNAIDQDYCCAAYSGELSAANFTNWIMCQACDRELMTYTEDQNNFKVYSRVPYEVQQRIRAWMNDKLYLFDNSIVDDGPMIDSLLKRFSVCARRLGCRLFLVDNLMMLTSGIEEELKAQARITAALKQFAVQYKAHVILVAHPRKTPVGQAFSSDDVAGSAAITNLADIVMSIEKPNIRVTKNREFGDTPFIQCCFDPATRRIYEVMQGAPAPVDPYQWDHSGLKLPEISVENNPYFNISYGRDDQPF